jgi:LmbE family N-acetylglucosaminyl deacetylase
MKTYSDYVRSFTALMADGRNLPYGGVEPLKLPPLPADAPRALIFAPHPDDECIIGGLALRLRRQSGFRVINVAVTLGSKKERQAERLAELKAACDYIGFDLLQTSPTGLEGVNLPTRENKPAEWAAKVAVIRRIFEETSPQVIFFPHERDWNTSHIGVYHLVMDALAQLPTPNPIHTIETEFWAQMPTPNLMVESTEEDVVALVAGTSFHVGEVKRNPYHLMLPAWLADNVRRGTEVVGGQGAASPGFKFATLYRQRRWSNSAWEPPIASNFLSAEKSPSALFL